MDSDPFRAMATHTGGSPRTIPESTTRSSRRPPLARRRGVLGIRRQRCHRCRSLAEAGIPEVDLVHAVRAIRSALHGFVDNERRGGFGMPLDIDESFAVMLDLILPG